MTKIQKIFEYLKSNVLEILGSMVVITIIIVITLLLAFSGQWVWFQTFGAVRVVSIPAAAVMQADTEAKSAAATTTAALKSAIERVEASSQAPTPASAPIVTAAVKPVVVRPQSTLNSASETRLTQSSQSAQVGSVSSGCGNGIDVAETQKMIALGAKNPDGSLIRVCNI